MRILITGVAGHSGHLLAERLVETCGAGAVVGVDARACRPAVPGLRFVRADLRQPEWTPLLEGMDVLVHLVAWPLRWRMTFAQAAALVAGGKHTLNAARDAGVQRIIVGHSGVVYGPQAEVPVGEHAVVRGHEAGPFARALAQLSDYLDSLENAWDAQITRLRSVPICGPRHDTLVRYLTAFPVLARGYESHLLQVVHEEDWMAALLMAVRGEVDGVCHVAPDVGIPLGEVADMAGYTGRPAWLPWLRLRARWRWRGVCVSPEWVDSLYRMVALDVTRLKSAGWLPRFSSRAALEDALTVLQRDLPPRRQGGSDI